MVSNFTNVTRVVILYSHITHIKLCFLCSEFKYIRNQILKIACQFKRYLCLSRYILHHNVKIILFSTSKPQIYTFFISLRNTYNFKKLKLLAQLSIYDTNVCILFLQDLIHRFTTNVKLPARKKGDIAIVKSS